MPTNWALLRTTVIYFVCYLAVALLPWPAWADTCTNMPGGWTKIAENNFNVIQQNGWFGGGGSVISDGSATRSAPNVVYNWRDNDENHGGDIGFNLSPALDEIYYCYFVKVSDPHYGWFNWYQKLSLVQPGAYQHCVTNEVAGSCKIDMVPNQGETNTHLSGWNGNFVYGNVSSGVVPFGTWIKMEAYLKRSSTFTSQNGTLRWWVNGTLVGDYSNANLIGGPFEIMWITNIWDAINTALPQAEWVEYDHVEVWASGGAPTPPPPPFPPPPPPIPTAPSNLRFGVQ